MINDLKKPTLRLELIFVHKKNLTTTDNPIKEHEIIKSQYTITNYFERVIMANLIYKFK
jgi:hypothetical protein